MNNDTPAENHVCGRCNQAFNSEDAYNGHACPATGFTPQQPEHLGSEFAAVSKAALERGKERLDETTEPEAVARQDAAIEEVSQKIEQAKDHPDHPEQGNRPESPDLPRHTIS